MGGGAHGAAAAADYYFGKSVKDLTLAESAMLAGLFKAPTRFAPHINLPAARARINPAQAWRHSSSSTSRPARAA